MLGVFALMIVGAFMEDTYRLCSDMRFCRENMNKTTKGWSIDTKSVSLRDRQVVAPILLEGKDAGLILIISQTANGFFRVHIEPTNIDERDFRFNVINEWRVFVQEVIHNLASITFVKNSTHVLITGVNHVSIAMAISPLRLSVVHNGRVIAVLNKYDELLFEHDREIKVPDEIWHNRTETVPNGPTSVGIDLVIPSKTVRLTGMSERNDFMNIQDTTWDHEWRMYTRDGYSWYGHVPLLVAHEPGLSFGAFWANPSDTFVSYGTINEGRKVRFVSEGGFLEMLFVVEPIKLLIERWGELTGKPAIPPLWAFGYQQSRFGYNTQKEALSIMDGLESRNIPYDVLWLDLTHLRGHAPWEYDHNTFPNPKEITDRLNRHQRHLARSCDVHLPTRGYHIQYVEGLSMGAFIRLANGKDNWVATCWPGNACWPDLLNLTVWHWYVSFHKYNEGRETSALLTLGGGMT
jgi:alpha 1,3-glucosidase